VSKKGGGREGSGKEVERCQRRGGKKILNVIIITLNSSRKTNQPIPPSFISTIYDLKVSRNYWYPWRPSESSSNPGFVVIKFFAGAFVSFDGCVHSSKTISCWK